MSRIQGRRAFVLREGEYIGIVEAVNKEEAIRIFRQRLDAPDFVPDVEIPPDVDFRRENKH